MQVWSLVDYIVDWLNKYCNKSCLNGFIVGVSGGIDSAVTSTICAMTDKPTTVVNMPILQKKAQKNLAEQHISWLKNKFSNVNGLNIDLTPIFNNFKKSMAKIVNDDLSMANSRSRIRMITLYAIASKNKLLVVGTGNKVEDFGIGFYTKYGDGGVDISPIADLMKSQIYTIGKKMGIINEIINAVPTDGLWDDGRCDESQIGATYDELEWAMSFFKDKKSNNYELLEIRDRSKKILNIYRYLRKKNYHKMSPIPVCIIPKKFL